MSGINFGIAMRNKNRADDAGQVAEALANLAVRQKGSIDELRQRIAYLEDELALSKACHEGCAAQVRAFAKQYPDSPLLVDSGKRYKDGDVKRRITLIYEAAFDATLIKISGISNPASRRAD